MLGFVDIYDQDYCLNYPPEAFESEVKNMGYKIQCVEQCKKTIKLDSASENWLNQTIKCAELREPNKVLSWLMTDYLVYEIRRGR